MTSLGLPTSTSASSTSAPKKRHDDYTLPYNFLESCSLTSKVGNHSRMVESEHEKNIGFQIFKKWNSLL